MLSRGISGRLRRKRVAVFVPRFLFRDELDKFRILSRAAEFLPAFHGNARAEKEDIDLHLEGRFAPDNGVTAFLRVSQLEIESERGGNEPEHRQLAVQTH